MTRWQLTMFLLTVSIMDGILVGVIVGALSGSPVIGVGVGVGSVAAIWGIVLAIGQTIGRLGTWRELRRRYPPVDGVDFERAARVISLGLGKPWMRMNNCIEAVADDGHLHLRIGLPGTGDGRPVSIPWEAVRRVERAGMGQARLDVEGLSCWLPRGIVAREIDLREAMDGKEDGS